MYCPVNNERSGIRCFTRCCRLYDLALVFLAALILVVIGLILGASFAAILVAAIPLLITAVVILFIIFIVTLLTRGCCNDRNCDND